MDREKLLSVKDPVFGASREDRTIQTLKRDGAECVWCRRPLQLGDQDLTIDHVLPKVKGGPAWPENEVIACYRCNHRRGAAMPLHFLEECEARGFSPNRDAILGCLLRLDRAIKTRGGCRRGRPKLEHQLRRMGAL